MEGVWRLTMVDTAASTNSSEAIILEISSPRTALKPTTSCVPVPPHLWLDYDDTRLRDASSERPNRGEGWIRSEDEIRLSFNIYYGEPAVGDTALTTHSGTVTKMKPALWVGSYQMSHRGPDYQIEQTAGIWRLEALPLRTSAD